MRLSEIVDAYLDTPSVGLMLDRPFIERSLKKAVRQYCAYAKLKAPPLAADEIHDPIDAGNDATGDQNFDLTPSEYGIIRPLFELYVELETATMLEASRGMGSEVFGRSVSEISQDITNKEMALPKEAFVEPAVTI